MADRVGQQLGNYRLIRLIGQGSFADVYLGVHIYLDVPSAIKVLHNQLALDDVDHFRNEARTIARLVHPHIVRVLEFGVEDTTPFLVMDYASNGTLRKRHPKGSQLPLATIVSYVNQVADALQYAHNQKVIHRDIKPENMLLSQRNTVLLSDFGIALVTSSRYNTAQGKPDLAGTIAYMAPEQIQAHAGPASDQYALGVVVYEWFSGERPFRGSFTEIAVKHTLVTPPPIHEKVPGLSPSIEEVVMRALAKEPKDRFPSVKAFANALIEASQIEPSALTAYLEVPVSSEQAPLPADADFDTRTTPISIQEESPGVLLAVPEHPSQPLMTTSQSNDSTPSSEHPLVLDQLPASSSTSRLIQHGISRRAVLLGLAGAAMVTAAGGGIAWIVYNQGAQGTLAPSVPSSRQGSALNTYRGHTDRVWSVAWSPNGKRIASASGDKTVQVWDAITSGNVYTYHGHTDSVYATAWSPDGKRIASVSWDKTVQVWDAANGGDPLKYHGHSEWLWTLAWSPGGSRIASAGGDKTVQVWDAATGNRLYTYRGHTDFIYAVAWSPDGRYIASSSGDGTVQVWDASNGAHVFTYQPYSALMWSLAWSPDSKRIASGGDDKRVQVWDAVNGAHPYIYYGHTDFVYAVAWSQDGKRIASGGDDRTVQVWDATDGSNFYTYSGHSNSVRSVAWSPGDKYVASGSWDKTVQVWKVG